MVQRFIELGEGYSDLYELFEIAKSNKHRLHQLLSLLAEVNGKHVLSFVVVLQPTEEADFQPLYICREGIPYNDEKKSKRLLLFEELAEQLQTKIVPLTVQPSTSFPEKELYYNYLIGVLRMNRFIPPMR
ncbi:MAG TPA: methylthioribose kinase [Massilibacterium sp.]|nr:methylthioribose kinase [Massilibacterium sp.]